jgi:hypothetical protein
MVISIHPPLCLRARSSGDGFDCAVRLLPSGSVNRAKAPDETQTKPGFVAIRSSAHAGIDRAVSINQHMANERILSPIRSFLREFLASQNDINKQSDDHHSFRVTAHLIVYSSHIQADIQSLTPSPSAELFTLNTTPLTSVNGTTGEG